MMKKILIKVASFMVCCVASIGMGPALAQGGAFPTKTVRIIVPFPAGGSADAMSRIVAQKLSDRWGQVVIVENMPGAGTVIGLNAVAKAEPDGYTLGMNSLSHVIQPAVRNKLPYDPVNDFTFITKVMESPLVLTVNASLQAQNFEELKAYALEHPGKLNFGSFGAGSAGHIFFEILKQSTGIDVVHIPYKGTGEMLRAELAGDIDMSFDLLMSPLPHIQEGKLRPILQTSENRSRELPDTPTGQEAGIDGLQPTWFGLVAPKGVPADVLDILHTSIADVLKSPDVEATLAKQGMNSAVMEPDAFRDFIEQSIQVIGAAATAAEIPKID